MAKAKWSDTSSYSRGDTKREPKSFQLGDSHRRSLKVHRMHGQDGWFLTCYDLGIEREPIGEDLNAALTKAVEVASEHLRDLVNALAQIGVVP